MSTLPRKFPPRPPRKTQDAREWTGELWRSMRRADVVLLHQRQLAPNGTTGILVAMELGAPLGERAEKAVKKYIRSYARVSGWIATDVRIERGYIAFGASITPAPHASRS